MPTERPSSVELSHAAYHEAAHAVASILLHVPFRGVSIVPSKANQGRLVQGFGLESCEPRSTATTRARRGLVISAPLTRSSRSWYLRSDGGPITKPSRFITDIPDRRDLGGDGAIALVRQLRLVALA